MSRDEGMTPEAAARGATKACRVLVKEGDQVEKWTACEDCIATALRSYGEQERRRARAEALEEAARLVVADASWGAPYLAQRIRALAEQPPPKEGEG